MRKQKTVPIVCVAVGVILAGIAALTTDNDREDITSLDRPSVGSGMEEYEVTVLYDGTESNIKIPVEERQLEFAEAKELLDEAFDEVMRIMDEENGDLSKVITDLYLPQSVFDGMISVSWMSCDRDYIGDNGIINKSGCRNIGENGQIVVLIAAISVQGYSAELEVPIVISPNIFSEEEKKNNIILSEIEKSGRDSSRENFVRLPAVVAGKEASYYMEGESSWWKYIVFGIMVATVYLLATKQKDINMQKARDEELKFSFAPIITKLTLLIGAGTSIRGAWEKLVNDYKKENKKNAAYEEMLRIHNEMQNGLPEGQAYVLFGKRCRFSQYVKLGNLLEQNLRKGTKGLAERLEYEVFEAFEERKAIAHRHGEEAGTKLLIPMVMSLGIVIVFCVVPAFLSM